MLMSLRQSMLLKHGNSVDNTAQPECPYSWMNKEETEGYGNNQYAAITETADDGDIYRHNAI